MNRRTNKQQVLNLPSAAAEENNDDVASKLAQARRRRAQRNQRLSRHRHQHRQQKVVPVPIVISVISCIVIVGYVLVTLVFYQLSSSSAKTTTTTSVTTHAADTQHWNFTRSQQGFPAYPHVNHSHPYQLSQQALDMCTHALWHTVETTTIVLPDEETFVHTGDIDDLWLRDSAAQLHTLMIHSPSLIGTDSRLDRIVRGLIKRTAMYIRHDPYANAFRIDDSYVFSEAQKRLGRHDLISTWNYELDSAAYYMRLVYYYWKQRRREPSSPDDQNDVLKLPQVVHAMEIMVHVWKAEQRHEDDVVPPGLDCQNCGRPYRYPGLPRDGKGSPTNPQSGLTWSGFRPSDDACEYHFLIPSNMMAVVALGYVGELATVLWDRPDLAEQARSLAREIRDGIERHAIVEHAEFGKIYAYEVDGLGNYNLMDDANIPSLLSIPYLGYPADPQIYANTRRFILSDANPNYHSTQEQRHDNNRLRNRQHPPQEGRGVTSGIGSPHMEERIRDNIWPMAMAMQGLTSNSVEERIAMVEKLVQVSAGTYWMHESFQVDNPSLFTRSWFCWADSLFAELVWSVSDACPKSNYKYKVMDWRDPVKVAGGRFSAV